MPGARSVYLVISDRSNLHWRVAEASLERSRAFAVDMSLAAVCSLQQSHLPTACCSQVIVFQSLTYTSSVYSHRRQSLKQCVYTRSSSINLHAPATCS